MRPQRAPSHEKRYSASAASAASGADCVLSLLEDDARFKERDHRRAGGGSRDEKLVEKIVEKLGRQAGFVRRDMKQWDTEQGTWVGVAGLDRRGFKECSFAIRHFGATVPYRAQHFCDKNVDPFDKELLTLMTGCDANADADFTRDLFAQPASQHRGIAFKFRDEMKGLVGTLNKCQGHFVRCIKPNADKQPFHFDEKLSRAQLQSCGVLEAAKVSQAGYPKRILFKEFFFHFFGPNALKGYPQNPNRPKFVWGDERSKKLVWELAVHNATSRCMTCVPSV